MTKEFADRRNLKIWIFLDLSPFLMENGSHVSIYARPSKESALMFSAIVMSAADSLGISVGVNCSQSSVISSGRGSTYFEDTLSRIQDLPTRGVSEVPSQDSLAWQEDAFRGARNSLVFFVSGFISDFKECIRMFDSVRITNKTDVVPVYLDLSWIWDMVEGTFEVMSADSSGRSRSIVTDAKGRSLLAQHAEGRRAELDDAFTEARLSWIQLTEPDPRQIEERMTNCFIEKLRGL